MAGAPIRSSGGCDSLCSPGLVHDESSVAIVGVQGAHGVVRDVVRPEAALPAGGSLDRLCWT